MSVTINGVTAKFGRDPDNIAKHVVTVQVYSQKRPGLKASYQLDPGAAESPGKFLQSVEAAGGAAAEYLGSRYGDNLDPAQCARDAVRAFGEECRLMAEQNKTLPAKVKRLETQAARLTPAARERLSRLKWIMDKNLSPTPADSAWVDAQIAILHGASL